LVEGRGGIIDHEFGTVQYGGKLKKKTEYRIYVKYLNKGPLLDLDGQNDERIFDQRFWAESLARHPVGV
jgi:hypothetical protein